MNYWQRVKACYLMDFKVIRDTINEYLKPVHDHMAEIWESIVILVFNLSGLILHLVIFPLARLTRPLIWACFYKDYVEKCYKEELEKGAKQ
jgi:hypothetical protein